MKVLRIIAINLVVFMGLLGVAAAGGTTAGAAQ